MSGHLPVVFDSAALPERDRHGFAREEYGRKALNVELEADRHAPFRLRLRAMEFGGVRVAIIESTPYRVHRTKPLIDDGDDRIGLVFPLAGRFGGEQGQRVVTVGRSEASTMLGSRPGWFGTPTGGAFFTVRAAPALFDGMSLDLGAIRSGATVKRSLMGFNLLRSYLSALIRAGDALLPAMRDIAGRHLAELATLAFCDATTPPANQADGESLRAARLEAALTHMATHFADPGYGIDACASHLGVSSRYLQIILEAAGKRFGEELKGLRLERARTLLADPLNTGHRVTDIALDCGFSDVSHFNRAFRARFGDTPTGLRGR